MQLQVIVDQAAALRRGINAPHTLAKVEVDPSQLSQEVRDVIASLLKEGYRLDSYGNYPGIGPVIEATQAGIVAKVESLIANRKEDEARIAQAKAEYLDALAKYAVDFRSDPRAHLKVYSHSTVEFVKVPKQFRQSWAICSVNVPHEDLSDEVNAIAQKVGQEMLTEAIAKQEAEKAAEAAKQVAEAAAAATYKAKLCDALTPEQAEQFKDGLMSVEKAQAAVRKAYRKSLGVTFTGDSDDWGIDSSSSYSDLTPSEYAALKIFRAKLPTGSVITCFYGDRVDEDGEKRTIAVAEATFPHPDFPSLKVSADCLLSETH